MVKKINFLGIKFVQDEKELVDPKLFEIKAINKRPYWTKQKITFFSILAVLAVVVIIVASCIPIILKIDHCKSIQCDKGVCVSDSNGGRCKCIESYYGDRCELFNYCYNVTCLNNANCVLKLNGYSCNCSSGYYGLLCESYNSCWNSPCEGCQPVKPNSTDYLCTCSRFSVNKCKSENLNNISTSLYLVELSDLKIASSFDDNTIRIANDLDFKNYITLNGHSDRINTLIEYDNNILASGSCDKTIRLWNTTSSQMISNLKYHNDCINALIRINYQNSANLLISGSDDRKITAWNGTSTVASINVNYQVKALAYADKLLFLAVGTSDKNIQLFSLNFYTSTIKASSKLDSYFVSYTIVYKNSQSYLVTGDESGMVKIWNISTYEAIQSKRAHSDSVSAFAVISNQSVASCSKDGTIKIWNTDTLESEKTFYSNESSILAISYLSNGILVSGSPNGLIQIWNLTLNYAVKNITVSAENINFIVTLDNGYFVTASPSSLRVWDATSWQLVYIINQTGSTFDFLKKLNNGNIVCSTDNGLLAIYDKSNFALINSAVVDYGNQYLISICVTQDGKIAVVDGDFNIKIWNATTLEIIAVFYTGKTMMVSVIFPLENDLFAYASSDSFNFWKLEKTNLNFVSYLNFSGHSNSVLALCFYRGSLLLSGSLDSTIKIWDLLSLQLVSTLTEHKQAVTVLSLVNNGFFASGSLDNSIIIWNTVFKDDTLTSHEGKINSIIYSKKRGYILSSSDDKNIIYWETNHTIENKYLLTGHKRQIEDLIALNDGNLLTASDDYTIKLWNASSNFNNSLTISGHTDNVYGLVQLQNNHIASCSRDQTIIIWNITTFQRIKTLFGHYKAVVSLATLKNDLLASGSCDSQINIWNITSFYLLNTLKGHTGCINGLVEFRNKYLISVSDDGLVNIWDNKTSSYTLVKSLNVSTPLNALAASNAYFAIGASNGSISVYGDSIEFEKDININKETARGLVLISNATNFTILGLSESGTIRMWNSSFDLVFRTKIPNVSVRKMLLFRKNLLVIVQNDYFLATYDINDNFALITSLNVSSNSIFSLSNFYDQFIITGSSDCVVRFWTKELNLNRSIEFQSQVYSLAIFSSNLIAVGLLDQTIRIWNIQQNVEVAKLEGHSGPIYVLYVLPNGNLVSGSFDYSIRIWSVKTYKCLAVLLGHVNVIESLIVLPNGNLVSGSSDYKIKLWDLTTYANLVSLDADAQVYVLLVLNETNFLSGTKLFKLWKINSLVFISQLNGHKNQVTDLKFLPNGNLVSSSMDNSIIAWDVPSRNILASNSEHTRSVLALATISNMTFASGSEDKTIRVWHVHYHEPHSALKNITFD